MSSRAEHPDTVAVPTARTERSLTAATLSVAALSALAKAFGFGEKVVVAGYFGTSARADVYFGVMGILWSVVFLSRELIHPSLLPVFSGAIARGAGRSAALFRRMFRDVALVLGAVCLVLLVGGRWVVRLTLPGFAGAQQDLTTQLLRCITPAIFCLAMTMLLYTCLNAHRRFAAAAMGQALFKVSLVVGLALLIPRYGIHAVAIVAGLSAGACLIAQTLCLPERGSLYRPSGDRRTGRTESRQVRGLMLPLVFGVCFSHFSLLVDNLLASTLPVGSLAYLQYAKKVVDALILIGPVALTTVAYSHIARLRASGRGDEVGGFIAGTCRLLIFASVPLSILIAELRIPAVAVLFERGQFDAASVANTSRVLLVYGLGVVAFALEGLFVYAFFAMSDTRTPIVMGLIFVVVDIFLAWGLMGPMGYVGIAAAYVFAKSAKVAVLGWLLSRRVDGMSLSGSGSFLLRLAATGTLTWFAARCAGYALSATLRDPASWVRLAAGGLAGSVAFVAASRVLKIKELNRAVSLLAKVVNRRRETGDGQ